MENKNGLHQVNIVKDVNIFGWKKKKKINALFKSSHYYLIIKSDIFFLNYYIYVFV